MIARVACVLVACLAGLGCSRREAEAEPDAESHRTSAPTVDPRVACVRAHEVPEQYLVVLRSLCAELHDLGAVGASVAIARDGELVFSTAVGRRCIDDPAPLRPDTVMRVGSISKVATAATALVLAENESGTDDELDLDADLRETLPELSAPVSLRSLLDHTSGLRDPSPLELISAGDDWVGVLDRYQQPPDAVHYANANYTVTGLWIERVAGASFPEVFETHPRLAPLREAVSFGPPPHAEATACGHARLLTWIAVPIAQEARLPAWTLPSGGALASAVDLVKLPHALERAELMDLMTDHPVPANDDRQHYGLGVRVDQSDDGPILAHSGNNGRFAADLQWSAHGHLAVAVLSNTPRHFKATLHAAWKSAAPADRDGG